MAISDLISTSFLFSISIVIILIGGIFAYVSYRMSEQDNKLATMLNVISTSAKEVHTIIHTIKSQKNAVNLEEVEEVEEEDDGKEINEIHIFDQNILSGGNTNNLISVSDNESCSESDNSESDNSESESEDSDSCSDEESHDEESSIDEDNRKILNLGDSINEFNHSLVDEIEEFNSFEHALDHSLDNSLDNSLEEIENELDNIKSIHLAEPIDLNISPNNESSIPILDASDLKTIMISDKPDYKKMGLNKLREIVVERNLLSAVEAGKLKKPELIKLLEDQ